MRVALKRTAEIIAAIVLIIIGIAGLVLPIIPGILLIVLGLFLLGVIEREHFTRLKNRFSKKKVYK